MPNSVNMVNARYLMSAVPMVTNRDLLKVATLKKKFFEQLPRLTSVNEIKQRDRLEVVGYVVEPSAVVVRQPNGHFYRVMELLWIDFLLSKENIDRHHEDWMELSEQLQLEIQHNMVQVFME